MGLLGPFPGGKAQGWVKQPDSLNQTLQNGSFASEIVTNIGQKLGKTVQNRAAMICLL